MAAKSENVSPTAYATGYLWYRNGMSHEALATEQGRKVDRWFHGFIAATRALTGVQLDTMLIARHKGIDGELARAIEAGRVGQVVEIAAGLSPRGTTFCQRYPKLTYIETDLPKMAALKRSLLDKGGLLSARHRVQVVDALAQRGANSLAALAKTLDAQQGVAVITEGLMSYLDPVAAHHVWRNTAHFCKRFPHGLYLSDAYLAGDRSGAAFAAFGLMISAFVRGRLHRQFRSAEHARERLARAGFTDVRMLQTSEIPETRELSKLRGPDRVRVLEAST
ncbi:MAG TPA: class I SAM-dependent methyltransferase [Nevskiaceae bacterium]|nr:class I SAM-dependent methyltransferase [Nevskiaceae bacterium]